MLRDYQLNAINEISGAFKVGHKRVLLVMPTGAGKTVVFCEIAKRAIAKGKRVGILTRGRKLVDQASQRLFREKVVHGVMMANHWNYRPHLPTQVCSIDTLISRKKKNGIPYMDLWIVDEGHLFGPKGKSGEILKEIQSFMLTVTATPYPIEGMAHLATTMLRPISMQDLIDQGFLVPFKYYAPSEPDLTGVRIDAKTKDYHKQDLAEKTITGQLTGKIIDHWKKIAQGLPTLCFAVNITHSQMLAQKFRDAGVRAEHCDADTSDKEREQIIKRLSCGETQVVCNVGIFCTGVDIPPLGALIMARPTKSLNLFIQQAGRGTRTAQGKTHCILLDHAGNIKRHGFPTMEPEVDLQGRIKQETTLSLGKICKVCFAVFKGKQCPECGVLPVPRATVDIEETDEELEEIQIKAKTPIEQWLEYLEQQRKQKGYKSGWQFWKLLEKFPYEDCESYLPDWFKSRHFLKREEDAFKNSPFGGVKNGTVQWK